MIVVEALWASCNNTYPLKRFTRMQMYSKNMWVSVRHVCVNRARHILLQMCFMSPKISISVTLCAMAFVVRSRFSFSVVVFSQNSWLFDENAKYSSFLPPHLPPLSLCVCVAHSSNRHERFKWYYICHDNDTHNTRNIQWNTICDTLCVHRKEKKVELWTK